MAAVVERIGTWGDPALTGIIAAPAEVDGFVDDGSILTDDFAPVDQLLSR